MQNALVGKYDLIFKHFDPKTGDTHYLGQHGPDKYALYAYECIGRNGKRKMWLFLRSKASAQKHILKKTGCDPFEEVVVEDPS